MGIMSEENSDEPRGKKAKLSPSGLNQIEAFSELNHMSSLQESNGARQMNGITSDTHFNSSMQTGSSGGSVLQDLLSNPSNSLNTNNSPRNLPNNFINNNRSPMTAHSSMINPPTSMASMVQNGRGNMRNVPKSNNMFETVQPQGNFNGQPMIHTPNTYGQYNASSNMPGYRMPPGGNPNGGMVPAAGQGRMMNGPALAARPRQQQPAGRGSQPSPAHTNPMMMNNPNLLRNGMVPQQNQPQQFDQHHNPQFQQNQVHIQQQRTMEQYNGGMGQNPQQGLPTGQHFPNSHPMGAPRPNFGGPQHNGPPSQQQMMPGVQQHPTNGMMVEQQQMISQGPHNGNGMIMNNQIQVNGGMPQRHQMNMGPNQVQVAPVPGVSNNLMANFIHGKTTQDPEKRKLIQQQLVLLLHAHRCQQREKEPSDSHPCNLPHCKTMKSVLRHMMTCNAGKKCSFSHCASSRQIIAHWKNCKKGECPVCKPLQNLAHGSGGVGDPKIADLMSQISNIGNVSGPSSVNPPSFDFGTSPGIRNSNTNQGPPSVGALINSLSNGPSTSTMNEAEFIQRSVDSFRSPNSASRSGANGNGTTTHRPNQNYHIPMTNADMPSIEHAWHQAVNQDLRSHLVQKLVKAIFPTPDTRAYQQDNMLNGLISYAKKVEREMFEAASDKEEYYHLLAEKIYKIQKELQEKKKTRENREYADGGRTTEEYDVQVHSRMLQDFSGESRASNENNEVYLPVVKMEVDEVSASSQSKIQEIKEEIKTSVSPSPSLAPTPTPVPSEVTAPVVKKEDIHVPEEEKIFETSELVLRLMPVLKSLKELPDVNPFLEPVDYVALMIPDYPNVIKTPMDISTIEHRLTSGIYKNPWEFCDDMWLMFENAWLYNKKTSRVHKCSTKVAETFTTLINPAMEELGYCCGEKLSFTPLALFCYGASMCVIARDQPYYLYEAGSTQFGVTVNDRYIYCAKCYEGLPDEGISLSDSPGEKQMAAKDKFTAMKNNQLDMEPFENCKICKRKWHKICSLYNKKIFIEGFICDCCRKEKRLQKSENKFTAKKLPHCNLSKHIEDRVNIFMDNKAGMDGDEKYEVVIRVLAVQDKEVEVKPLMKNRYGNNANSNPFPDKFPYKTKAIFAFEVVDGVEVCFFGLHVQEYGSKCPTPNARRVYIAYLDSVHFFQPRHLRTEVYHEILLSYLDYAKQLGYTMAHIWACPPSEGDDYIFHCHPPEQKIPKPKRLQDWYKKMLDKGVQEKTVIEYKDIHKQAKDDLLTTPITLPYFEGDFWPNVIEDCIRDVEKEEAERKNEEGDDDGEEDTVNVSDNSKNKKTTKTVKKKGVTKKAAARRGKKGSGSTGNEVADKLLNVLEKHKEVFFTIKLSNLPKDAPDIVDPDALMPSELMDGRDTFLNKAREEHWEFSSLRRAKYSTICFCYALHVQSKDQVYCNLCQGKASLHCTTCDDFDLCNKCHTENPHEHHMEKIESDLLLADDSRNSENSSRTESVQRCIKSLVHACSCRDANCRRATCHKMKKVVAHTKSCKKRHNSSCSVCKQLIALCCYHAKHCTLSSCAVPYCGNIRQKLQEQKRSKNRRADKLMRRRMDLLNLKTSGSVPPAGPATNSTSSATHDNASKSSTTSKEESGSKSMGTSYHGSISASNSNSNLASKSVGSVPSQPAPSPMNVATQDSNSMPYNSQMPQQGSANPQLSGFNNHPQNTPYNQSTGNLPMNSQQQQAHYQNTMQMRGNVGGMQGNMPLNQQSHQMQRQKSQSGFAPQRPGMTPQQLQQQQQQQQQQMLMRNQTGGPNIPYNQPNMQQQMGRPGMQHRANQQVFDTSPENMQKMAHVHDRIKKAGTEEEKERIFAELKVNPSMMSQYLMYTEHEKKQNSYAGGRSMQPGPGNQPNWNAQVNQRMPMNHGQQPPQHNPGQYQQNMNNSQWQGQNYHNRGN